MQPPRPPSNDLAASAAVAPSRAGRPLRAGLSLAMALAMALGIAMALSGLAAAAGAPSPTAPAKDTMAAAGPAGTSPAQAAPSLAPDDDEPTAPLAAAPAGLQRLADLPYGPAPRHRVDLYLPAAGTPLPSAGPFASQAAPTGRPLVLMVHGGGWQFGDKSMRRVVANKAAHWVARGVAFASTNYRLMPGVTPLQQADDVARALAMLQTRAGEWQIDAGRIVLMGHSAGAHLVALLSADPSLAQAAGAGPWLGSVMLDTAALDVERLMQGPHAPLFDRAFGDRPADWEAASPMARIGARPVPSLLVCSTRRREDPCDQAREFARRLAAHNVPASVLPQARSHWQINDALGLPGAYTQAVDVFLARLDPVFLPPR